MERRKFIKMGCVACMTGFAIADLLSSCATTQHIDAAIQDSDLIIPISDFYAKKDDPSQFKKYLIVQNDRLKFPICIYRINAENYNALWMQCTHQGAELQVFGDVLQCPAHGSEFSNTGKVINAPASQNLKTFPVIIEKNQIKISLK